MNLKDLQKIETKTTRGERNFELKTALMKIFKALSWLFDGRKDVPEEKIAKTAKIQSRRLGLGDRYNWNEIFGLKEVNQNIEQQLTFANGNPYPDNFYIGQAIANGSCFFDSFRQGLEQQKGIKVTVEQLRKDCQEFAQKNPPEWFTRGIANSYDNYGNVRRETITSYGIDILDHNRWGDPEVEGRILCEKYGVNVHIVERQTERKGAFFDEAARFLNQRGGAVNANALRKKCLDFVTDNELPEWFIKAINDEHGFSLDEYKKHLSSDVRGRGGVENVIYGKNNIEGKILSVIYSIHNFRVKEFRDNVKCLHQIVDKSGSTGTGEYNRVDYNSDSVLHIINNGGLHFEPLLDKNKELTKQPQEQTQEQRELQEKGDYQLAVQLQGQEYRLMNNMERQAQVISSFMLNASQEHLVKQIQEDHKLAERLQQEEDDYELAMELQAQENNLLVRDNEKNTFQEKDSGYAGELLAKILQREGRAEFDCFVKALFVKAFLEIHGKDLPKHSPKENSPNDSLQELRLTPHQQNVQQAIKGH